MPNFRDHGYDPTDHNLEDGEQVLTAFGLTPVLPEHLLLIAFLQLAANDYAGHALTPQHIRRDAERWLKSRSQRPWAYRWGLST